MYFTEYLCIAECPSKTTPPPRDFTPRAMDFTPRPMIGNPPPPLKIFSILP